MRKVARLLIASAIMSGSSATLGAQTIDTRSASPSSVFGGSGIYGQSFVVPNGYPFLEDFTFWVGPNGNGYFFRTQLFAFDEATHMVTGSALYTSDVRSSMGFANDPNANAVTFDVGGLSLTPGGLFAAFVEFTDGSGQPTGGSLALGFNGSAGGDAYADGGFLIGSASGANMNQAFFENAFYQGSDLRFVANFAEVAGSTVAPEPATMMLLGTGLFGLTGVATSRRRRRSH